MGVKLHHENIGTKAPLRWQTAIAVHPFLVLDMAAYSMCDFARERVARSHGLG
jgi:hypothetical protein